MALDAADLADGERDVDAGHVSARRGEAADETGAGVRRAADDLHRLAASPVPLDRQHLQLVGVGMLLGGQHPGDRRRA